jgi:hypothetical protein
MVEIKDFHESKFPEKEFTAKLTSMEIKTVGERETDALVLSFEPKEGEGEEPIELNVFGVNKVKDDGRISDFMMFGKFIQSIRKLGLKPDITDNVFTTSPSILHKVVTMTPLNERKVTGDSGEKTYRDWGVSKIEGLSTSGGKPKETIKTDPSKMIESWKEFLLEHLAGPTNEMGIMKLCNTHIKDPAAKKPFSESRKTVLAELVKEGFLDIDGDAKYTLKE